MGLTLHAGVLREIAAHAAAGYPHEVVGILAGARARGVGDGDGCVTRVAALVNERADSARNRYAVSALALARAEQRLEADGLAIVGYYHSHPDHPSRYSDFDRDQALPNMSYLILAVTAGRATSAQSWRLREDRSAMDEEPIRVRPRPTTTEDDHPLQGADLMPVTIHIPTALRPYTAGNAVVSVAGDTAGEALDALTTAFPTLSRHLRTEDGKLRSFVNVYLNDQDIRFLGRDAAPLAPGDSLTIVPSIAGGAT